ncbi:YciI family protein [Synechococcus sp. PCC 7336]|uniref:YciI family protein n=1 Tax=Synechococcus sp. PCC 7336 TaxID=195250 RepID=UPI00034535F2|nr:YciI family protein [Synechococcus sp. PCC 7336]
MPWFVKIEHGIVPKTEFDRHVPDHLAYVRELAAKGHRAQTGYWRGAAGGMLVFEAESRSQAQQIVDRDPLVRAGCVEYELHEWVKAH